MHATRLQRPDLIIDPHSISPIQLAHISELRQEISVQLKTLPKVRRTVIELHFGLRDGFCYTERDIALIMRWSPNRARAVINTSIYLLRKDSCIKTLLAFCH